MKDIIRHILKEDKKERFYVFILNDMLEKTRFKTNHYSNARDTIDVYLYDGSFFSNFYVVYNDEEESVSDRIIDNSIKINYRHVNLHMKNEHVKYGLSYNAFAKVYDRYLEEVIRILKEKLRQEPLNESENKKERFLKFVVDDLVENTKIVAWINFHTRSLNGIVNFPFFDSNDFDIEYYDKVYSPLVMLPSLFSDYCVNNYGLHRYETKVVWEKYRTIIKDKIENIK